MPQSMEVIDVAAESDHAAPCEGSLQTTEGGWTLTLRREAVQVVYTKPSRSDEVAVAELEPFLGASARCIKLEVGVFG